MIYKLCKTLAAAGKLTQKMIEVYYAANRITSTQYEELLNLIK